MNSMHKTFLAGDDWKKWLQSETVPWIDRMGDLGDHLLEIGPGPGLTTDLLRERTSRVTAVELDPELASALAARMEGMNVTVIEADASNAGLESGAFSAAACFSMLHHVPSAETQDRVFAEVARMLRPGAMFLATDSLDSDAIRSFHEDDIFNPIDPSTLSERLERAGFSDVAVETTDFELRFSARSRD